MLRNIRKFLKDVEKEEVVLKVDHIDLLISIRQKLDKLLIKEDRFNYHNHLRCKELVSNTFQNRNFKTKDYLIIVN